MWLVSHATGWSDRSGRFGDTMRWVRKVIAGRLPTVGAIRLRAWTLWRYLRWLCETVVPCKVGLPRLGRFGNTIRRVGMGQLLRWDARATPLSVVGNDLHVVQDGTARDALRYHAVGLVWAGLPKVGTFRRHHHGACFQTIELRCLEGRCGVYGFKVGQGLGPQRICIDGYASVVNAKKQVEIAKARSCVNAPQAIITCIEAAMRPSSYADGTLVEERVFKQLTVGDQAWQRSRIRSRRPVLWVLITWAVTSP